VPADIDSYRAAFEATTAPTGKVTDISYALDYSWSTVRDIRFRESTSTTIIVTSTEGTWEYQRDRVTKPLALDLLGWQQSQSGQSGAPCAAERMIPLMDIVAHLRSTILSDAFRGYRLFGAPHCVLLTAGNEVEASRTGPFTTLESAVADSLTGWLNEATVEFRFA